MVLNIYKRHHAEDNSLACNGPVINRGRGRGYFSIFAPFLTRHLVRHSTECEGGSSKSDGWFAAIKGAVAGGAFSLVILLCAYLRQKMDHGGVLLPGRPDKMKEALEDILPFQRLHQAILLQGFQSLQTGGVFRGPISGQP